MHENDLTADERKPLIMLRFTWMGMVTGEKEKLADTRPGFELTKKSRPELSMETLSDSMPGLKLLLLNIQSVEHTLENRKDGYRQAQIMVMAGILQKHDEYNRSGTENILQRI